MSYSDTIPVNIVPYVRTGARAELDDAMAKVQETDHRTGAITTREWENAQEQAKHYDALLRVIGQPGDKVREIELEPSGDHLTAIRGALERFERDHPDDARAASEIEAFRLDVGLTFKTAEGGDA